MSWQERFHKEFSGQSQLSQAILGALEYRGFYDAGKYLDDDISERIAPILKAFIQEVEAGAREEGLNKGLNKRATIEHELFLEGFKKGAADTLKRVGEAIEEFDVYIYKPDLEAKLKEI